jgi:hypothetical protein
MTRPSSTYDLPDAGAEFVEQWFDQLVYEQNGPIARITLNRWATRSGTESTSQAENAVWFPSSAPQKMTDCVPLSGRRFLHRWGIRLRWW